MAIAWALAVVRTDAQSVSNTAAVICIKTLDERGAPVTNVFVTNPVADGKPHHLARSQATDANGVVRWEHPVSPRFFVYDLSGDREAIYTNVCLTDHCTTNVIMMRRMPNNPAHATGQPAPGR